MLPVTVLTGFLGSGKTTLLARLLRDPGFGRVAVIVNEWGEIGLDHELLATSEESFVGLAGGCLCCRVRSDLVATLLDLAARGAAGNVPPFERVVIETSGLADPAPILHALTTEREVGAIFGIDRVVTLVDALGGTAALDGHAEARRQVALADRLFLTKTDLAAPAAVAALRARLAALNPGAPAGVALHGAVPAGEIAGGGVLRANADPAELMAWLAPALLAARGGAKGAAGGLGAAAAAHDASDQIASFALVRERPIAAAALSLFLEALADNAGPSLLRLKGLVAMAEDPARPVVVHGMQHVFHPPAWLERWPSADRRSRLVFIGRGIPPAWPGLLLEAIEAEVADEVTRRAGAPEQVDRP